MELAATLSPGQVARVVDLTGFGLLLETPEWLDLGRRYRLELEGESLPLVGTVVRSRAARLERLSDGTARQLWEFAIDFEDLDTMRRHRLERLAWRGGAFEPERAPKMRVVGL